MNTSPPFSLSKHETEILQIARSQGSCTINELARLLSVSDETIRRHVKPLAKKGLVHRVHGGIVLPDQLQEAPYLRRMDENKQAKLHIAQKAAALIQNGESLFLDSGATTAYVARALNNHRDLSVVTNSVDIARLLATRNHNRVYMAGGELRGDDAAAFGKTVIDFIRQFHISHAILSVGAINAQGEFFNYHLQETEVSRAAIRQADKITVVADVTKFTRQALVRICALEDVDSLVCDKAPPEDIAQMFALAETKIEVAS
ncbi:MAG: DeoR/GlpR transcriptional regulator [Methylococcales bacterium]|nr:DeoR/GlpR transcriptional regulator [Methylococcales bacterium]